MNYDDWVKLAHRADQSNWNVESEHYYLQLGVGPGREIARNKRLKNFVSSDFNFFSTTTNNFFITDVSANKGIQCRFGMKNVIAEAHYDGGKNMVAMAKGAKRYILTPPTECKKLEIIVPRAHPSFRHSSVDWSDNAATLKAGFDKAQAIDTILHAGEVSCARGPTTRRLNHAFSTRSSTSPPTGFIL
jgi:hypothetical protein